LKVFLLDTGASKINPSFASNNFTSLSCIFTR
jgi:hypothetical protein